MSTRAIYAVAVAISAAADGATGRNAMPGNVALTGDVERDGQSDTDVFAGVSVGCGYGLTTVQKAVQVLLRRGWLVLVRAGKNRLTATERRELWHAGSKARQRRNVWACATPLQLHEEKPVGESAHGGAADRGGCALPTTRRVVWVPSVGQDKNLNPAAASRTGAPRRAYSRAAASQRRYCTDPRVVRLATDLRARVPWLRHVPHQRIMPALHRFATTDWTAAQLQVHLDRLLARRGWSVPTTRTPSGSHESIATDYRPTKAMRSPWGYLAYLLRQIDPSDLAAERQHAAELEALELYQRALIFGAPCPHGQPAGDLPSPNRGVLACPMCRHNRLRSTKYNNGHRVQPLNPPHANLGVAGLELDLPSTHISPHRR